MLHPYSLDSIHFLFIACPPSALHNSRLHSVPMLPSLVLDSYNKESRAVTAKRAHMPSSLIVLTSSVNPTRLFIIPLQHRPVGIHEWG